jgi:hypothetical protein
MVPRALRGLARSEAFRGNDRHVLILRKTPVRAPGLLTLK